MARAERGGVTLVIPSDVVVADAFSAGRAEPHGRRGGRAGRLVHYGHWAQDTGHVQSGGRNGKTILWNGPMGVFEMPAFSRGTREFAAALGSLDGVTTVLGGGSTAEVVHELGITDRITHVSTGGGASLEFLEGRTLPVWRLCWTRRLRAMIDFPHIADVCQSTPSKVVMLLWTDWGRTPSDTGRSELEEARNAQPGRAGVAQRLRPDASGTAGITPGSGRVTCRSSATIRSSTP